MTKKVVKEAINLKIQYELEPGLNYDKNAADNKIKSQTLITTPVDTCG